jgi:hypothetical protein
MANTTSLQSLFSQSYANVLADVLAKHPSTTVADLRDFVSQHPQAGALTLSELFGASPSPARAAKPAAKAKAKAAKPAAAKPVAKPAAAKPATAKSAPAGGGWNVRTEAGRAALQQAVLDALRSQGGKDVRAEQLRSVGAAPTQLRATLNKLIEDGAVTFTGQARGTRYSLV